MRRVKKTTITYGGYDYQTLVGVIKLIDWVESPELYTRVRFDADDDADEAPQGIDDIVCERPDGRTDFYQVKFTPNSTKDSNRLTWEFLLKRSGKTDRSRTILQKLSGAINAVSIERLGLVALYTNKRPDREFEKSLVNEKIDLDLIDEEVSKQIVNQLGSIDTARRLFNVLSVQHSAPDYHSLEADTLSRIDSISNIDGYYRLTGKAKTWAIYADLPSIGGWIDLGQVREILSARRPQPIPQSFLLPDYYSVPDANFHDCIFELISSGEEGVVTLTGAPGQGKSTYVSYLCECFASDGIPVIRHHYFLSNADTTLDRLTYRVVAESLLDQLSILFPDLPLSTSKPEHLRDMIALCAEQSSKPLVVVIDGLDHVWRDNFGNTKPLDHLFKNLLPPIHNVVFVIGTQPVEDELLPQNLLRHCNRLEWHSVPPMGGNAIYNYLDYQASGQRITIAGHPSHYEENLSRISSELVKITRGYPLYLIYSVEFLANRGGAITEWSLKSLPRSNSRGIGDYYNTLWSGLSNAERDVLHVICHYQFSWPVQAISKVLENSNSASPSSRAVAHLLFEGRTGLSPFHESLVVFVRGLKEHEERIIDIQPKVCAWLEKSAPEYIHHTWYWIIKSESGDSAPLFDGLTRNWVLDRLSEGYEISEITRILSYAEKKAFQNCIYSTAYRLRDIKTRVLNGIDYQVSDKVKLEVYSNLLSPRELNNHKFSSILNSSPRKLATQSLSSWFRGEAQDASELALKATKKHKSNSQLQRSSDYQEADREVKTLIQAAALTDTLDFDRLLENKAFDSWRAEFRMALAQAYTDKIDIEKLSRILASTEDSRLRHTVDLSISRLCLVEDIEPSQWDSPQDSVLSEFSLHIRSWKFGSVGSKEVYLSKEQYSEELDLNYHDWFFQCLRTYIHAIGDFTWLSATAIFREHGEEIDISSFYSLLQSLAVIAGRQILETHKVDVGIIIGTLNDEVLKHDSDWRSTRVNYQFQNALVEILCDLHWSINCTPINDSLIECFIDSNLFGIGRIRSWYSNLEISYLSDSAAARLIERDLDNQFVEVSTTAERAEGNLELADIARRHGNLALLKRSLWLCWDYVIGYGYHKDRAMIESLGAIDHIGKVCAKTAFEMTRDIASLASNTASYTDGDGSNEVDFAFTRLISQYAPLVLAQKYNDEVESKEWYLADITLEQFLLIAPIEHTIVQSIYMTGVGENILNKIREKADSGEKGHKDLLLKLQDKFRWSESKLTSGYQNREVLDDRDNEPDINYDEYTPSMVAELNLTLGDRYATREIWRNWYQHWSSKGFLKDLIGHLIPHIENSEGYSQPIRAILDQLYLDVRKIYGKKKAFDVLVLSHKLNGGWSDWHESEEASLARLTIVAEQYPTRVHEFISLTTAGSPISFDRSNELIIPQSKLVYLLAKSGYVDGAKQLASEMQVLIKSNTRNIAVDECKWVWSDLPLNEKSYLSVLISRFRLPLVSIKHIAAMEIAELLARDFSTIEPALLDMMSGFTLETECVDVLSILLIASSNGYRPTIDVGDFIHARSILSDMILRELGQVNMGQYAGRSFDFTQSDKHRLQFEKANGRDFPAIYQDHMEYISSRMPGLPVLEAFVSEWSKTYKHAPHKTERIDYFLNPGIHHTSMFSTRQGHRGRSAYLRVLDFLRVAGMPNRVAEFYGAYALPIDPCMNSIKPAIPSWLIDWQSNTEINEQSVSNFLYTIIERLRCSEGDLELAHLSFPVKISDNEWLDVTFTRGIQEAHDEGVVECFYLGESLECPSYLTTKFREPTSVKVPLFAPIVCVPVPLKRFGYWLYGLLMDRGFAAPIKSTQEGGEISYYSRDGLLIYRTCGVDIGHSGYWHQDFQSSHPIGISPLVGTYTLLDTHRYHLWASGFGSANNKIYHCKIKHLSKEYSHSEFEKAAHEFFITDNLHSLGTGNDGIV